MGSAKIKRWFEQKGLAVHSVVVLKVKGSPVVTGFEVQTKAGKKGHLPFNARQHDLENLRRVLLQK